MIILESTYQELNKESFTYRMIKDYIQHEAGKQDPKYIVEHLQWLIEVGEGKYEREH